ncbi:MAG: putative metal-binding motif-containing protein [Patescibacteria group bacterium]
MCKIRSSALVALALASASCDCNPFGNIEAEYSGQDAIAQQPGVDTSVPEPEPDTFSPPVFVCEDKDNDNFCENSVQESDQDCNDNVAFIHPGASEVCDNVDQNCNGVVDESTGSVWYLDKDNDGFGDSDQSIVDGCDGANFLVSIGNDCDDEDVNVNPNATEVCNGKDDDCDEDVDDEDTSIDKSTTKTWYVDEDGDGFGDGNVTLFSCDQPNDYVANADDCDDSATDVYPDSDEFCDEQDNDCDGLTDEGVQTFSYQDSDDDGFGNEVELSIGCGVAEGYVLDKTDCDDLEGHTYPGGGEICDGEDNDCDGKTDEVAAGENLCDDSDKLTTDTCDAETNECMYEDVEFVFTCELPDEFPADEGYTCGIGVFFDDDDGYSEVLMLEEGELTLLASDVCAQVSEGYGLYVNSYVVQWEVDFAFLWVGGQYVTITDSLTGKEISGTPGNVTILAPGLDFQYGLENIEICQ